MKIKYFFRVWNFENVGLIDVKLQWSAYDTPVQQKSLQTKVK